MSDFNEKGKVVITCKDRFSSYLEAEVKDLGFKPKKTTRTTVELYASLNECIFLNMHLRTASHVLYEIKTFYLQHVDDLYRRVKSLPWELYINNDTYFSVNSTVDHESVDNPLFVNVRVKDAIVDRFRENTGLRPDSGSEYNGAVFQLYWKERHASIYINTSGETIAKHGYRKIPGNAPMLEALAAATIMATDWDKESLFVNPMCGSGTLAIEAALLASNRYPGLFRSHYGFMYIKGYEADHYDALKKELVSKVNDNIGAMIIASDISEMAINNSRENARAAGVMDLIDFQVADFEATEMGDAVSGTILFNPEYGERMGEGPDLENTYARIGDFMKNKCQGFTGFVFTGNLDLSKKIGLRPKRRIEFYNGTIDCRLMKYELYSGSRRPNVAEKE